MLPPRFFLFRSLSDLVARAELSGESQISLNVPSARKVFVYAKNTNPSSRVSPRWNLSPVIGLTRLISILLIQKSPKSYANGKICRFTRLRAICHSHTRGSGKNCLLSAQVHR